MGQPVIQPSFAAGELSPALWARVDLAKFHVGAALLQNFYVDYRGGISNRPGTKFIDGSLNDSSGACRLIPFTFSTVQTYALLFTDLKMRVVKDGGLVLETAKNITAITKANPGVITSNAHGFSNGDWVTLAGIGGMTQLNGLTVLVANKTANTFEIQFVNAANIDTTNFTTYTSGGTASRVYTVTSPYAAADLPNLKYSQSADTMTLTHPGYAVRQLTRSGHAAWAFTTVTFAPSTAAPTSPTVVNSLATGSTTYRYVITSVALQGGRESLPSAVATVTNAKTMSLTAGSFNTVAYTVAAGAQFYNIYRQTEIDGSAPDPDSLYGFVGSSMGDGFVDQNIIPDFSKTPPIAYNPFSGADNYPSCSTYFQGRQIFAATNNSPQLVVASKSADYLNLDYSTPGRADDSIQISLVAQDVNAIRHLVPMTTLIALTSSGSWRIDSGANGGPMTPDNVDPNAQTYNGASQVRPVQVDSHILYVQDKGQVVQDMNYDLFQTTWQSKNISVLSSHLLFRHSIIDWAWAQQPQNILWAVRDDGVLLSLTYLKEQDVYAWAHHVTNGRVLAICAITEGNEDAIYIVVQRIINGDQATAVSQFFPFLERLASRQYEEISQAWFLDAALQYPLTYPNANVLPSALDAEASIASVTVVYGGTGYSAPEAHVVDLDGQGSGAELGVTISGGVITSVAVNVAGSGYVRPIIEITDTTGSRAVLTPVVQKVITLTADAAVFASGDLGKVVRISGGIGTVVFFTSSTVILINLTTPLSTEYAFDNGDGTFAPQFQAAGDWSMTTPVTTVSGLWHLEGKTVGILADGNVQPRQVVSGGAIVLEQPATAILVGLPYVSRLETLYLDIPGEAPTAAGRRKKINAVTVRMEKSRGMKVGVKGNNSPYATVLRAFKERTTEAMGQAIQPFTGDERVIIDPAYTVAGQLVIEEQDPLPATILGVIPEVVVSEA